MTTATTEFQVGQLVRFSDTEENGHRAGFTGRIAAIPSVAHGGDLIDLEVVTGDWNGGGWFPHRFEIVDETPTFEIGQRAKVKDEATLHGTTLTESLWGTEGVISAINLDFVEGPFITLDVEGRTTGLSADLACMELVEVAAEPEPEPEPKVVRFEEGDKVIISENASSDPGDDGRGYVNRAYKGQEGTIIREGRYDTGTYDVKVEGVYGYNTIHRDSLQHVDPIAIAVREALAERDAELEEFKRQLSKKAMDMAERHGYCTVVEGVLTDAGLPIPKNEIEATYTVTIRAQRNEYARNPLDDLYYVERIISGVESTAIWKDVAIQDVKLVAGSAKMVEESAS
jgi:ribosomal protein L21E